MSFASFAQVKGPVYTVTPWPDNPALHKVPDAFKDASAVF